MKESLIFYLSQYQAISCLTDEQLGRLFRTIFEKQLGNDVNIDDDIKIAFNFINNQLSLDADKWEEEKNKRSEAGRIGGIKRAINQGQNISSKSKQCLNVLSTAKQSQANQAENVNENENENENVEGVMGDSCVDGPEQLGSRVDEVVNFFENNIGMITPHEFDVLDSYRQDFSDDIIIYALQLQVEKRATGVSYAKAILNNWKKKNIKTLLEAKNENGKIAETKSTNTYHAEDDQYTDLSKFYMN